MATWERPWHQPRRKNPSFSSSLLDAIYQSLDETKAAKEEQEVEDFAHNRRKHPPQVEEEIESLRRAIKVEKWMDNYTNSMPRHLPSNSGSSTDSSFFSSSETESSASKSTPKSSVFTLQRPKQAQINSFNTATSREEKFTFTRTKSRALKIYGDLKKVKEPISPGGKIANFLNSIFSPRHSKKQSSIEEWSNSVRKSRSMKDATLASRSCLIKTPSSRGNKSKRSVRFCPVNVILDEDCQPCAQKNIYNHNDYSSSAPVGAVGSQFIKKNIDSFRLYEVKNLRKQEFREFYDENQSDVDDKSCSSSDLFELDNIGRAGIKLYEEELPVYGTTSVKINQAIASGLIM